MVPKRLALKRLVPTRHPRRAGLAATGVSLLAAATLAGCSSGAGGSAGTSTSTSAGPSSSVSTTPTSSPAATASLTAWGATLGDWNANHTADPAHPGNYWPKLPNGLDSYTSQGLIGGRVIHYVLNFDPAQSESDGRQSMANELPTDATVLSSRRLPGCEQVVETSPTLRSLVHADVLGELASPHGFDPSAVNRLTLSAVAPGSPPPASC